MENAAAAVSSLFSSGSKDTTANTSGENKASSASTTNTAGTDKFETKDGKVAPAVEHTHVKKEHETRVQTEVEKERHQDHYHTTVQPLKDGETRAEKHDYTEETHHKNINRDDKAGALASVKDRAGFEDSKDEKTFESTTTEPTKTGEHVHHHLHETIQPVIEKEVIDPSVTHHKVNIKEKIQDPSVNHGVTTKSAMNVDDFKDKIEKN